MQRRRQALAMDGRRLMRGRVGEVSGGLACAGGLWQVSARVKFHTAVSGAGTQLCGTAATRRALVEDPREKRLSQGRREQWFSAIEGKAEGQRWPPSLRPRDFGLLLAFPNHSSHHQPASPSPASPAHMHRAFALYSSHYCCKIGGDGLRVIT
ncbi:hypothetical protein IQ07DRAFT_331781 [Pyrenochaeta sp. DS3sAY3a]|nr:hypothetical protein IQ07DRAFT_331781 [Pyrenochaeta sp. DS3sAY3a]